MKYCGISRPDVDVSLPNVNVWPARLRNPSASSNGSSPEVLFAMKRLWKSASMSRWAIAVAPLTRSRACTPVRPPIHARWMSPISNARTTAV